MRTFLGKIGELILKGSNIKTFERSLVQNTKSYLRGVNASVKLNSGRLYIECDDDAAGKVEWTLRHLIGITGWAEAVVVEKNIESIQKEVLNQAKIAREKGARTFKIDTKRSDKTFPLAHYELCCEAASLAFNEKVLSVDVHNPDVTIALSILTPKKAAGGFRSGFREEACSF